MTEIALYLSVIVITVLFIVIAIMLRKNIEQRTLIHELANKIRNYEIEKRNEKMKEKNEENSNSGR